MQAEKTALHQSDLDRYDQEDFWNIRRRIYTNYVNHPRCYHVYPPTLGGR